MKTISLRELSEIMADCRGILARYDITIYQPVPRMPLAPLVAALRKKNTGTLDYARISIRPTTDRKSRKRPVKTITRETLCEITVLCAETFRNRGFDIFWFSETLNGLYNDLRDVLVAQGISCQPKQDATRWDLVRKRLGINDERPVAV